MTDINSVFLVGRLTKDIEVSYLQTGTAKGECSLAVNSSKKVGEDWVDEASFFNILIWGKMAEGIKNYLLKGKQVAVLGKLKQDRWEKDGQKQSRIYVIAEAVQLVGGNSSTASDAEDNVPKFKAVEESQEEIPF